MTTFLLVRHAAHDWLGRGLAGRLPGVGLNAQGLQQAQALAQAWPWPLDAIVSSPQQRTQETVAALARRFALPVTTDPAFDEIDLGAWTGATFDALRQQGEAWTQWVERRGSAQPPGGEPFAAVPRRGLAGLRTWQQRYPEGHVLVASHGDVIKALVAQCLGLALDHLERFEIAPASVSIIAMGADWQQVRLVNARLPPA